MFAGVTCGRAGLTVKGYLQSVASSDCGKDKDRRDASRESERKKAKGKGSGRTQSKEGKEGVPPCEGSGKRAEGRQPQGSGGVSE